MKVQHTFIHLPSSASMIRYSIWYTMYLAHDAIKHIRSYIRIKFIYLNTTLSGEVSYWSQKMHFGKVL